MFRRGPSGADKLYMLLLAAVAIIAMGTVVVTGILIVVQSLRGLLG